MTPHGLTAVLIADNDRYEVYDLMWNGRLLNRVELAKGDPALSALYIRRHPRPWGNIEFGRRIPCCDMHNRNCEPPSELCCHECTEVDHPGHQWAGPCSASDESPEIIAAT